MEEDFTARLLANPGIAALFGKRINWGERPAKDPLPGATLLLVSPGRRYVHGGADPTGSPRVQIDCYGASFAQARAGARAIRDALETPANQGRTAFSTALLEAERGPLVEDVGGGLKVHRVSMDFFVWFSPAA